MPAMAGEERSFAATGYAGRRSARGCVPTLERGNDQKSRCSGRVEMNPVLRHDECSYRGHGPLPTLAVLVGCAVRTTCEGLT